MKRSYVTRSKPTAGIKKHLRGWECKLDADGYLSLEGYYAEGHKCRNPYGLTLADYKIVYPAIKRRFEYVF